nr:hypothetical protein DVH24_036078 [Ipomoea batatas]GMD15857.1 hypothetical protein DVH24_036078 [Ipomoea batatas]
MEFATIRDHVGSLESKRLKGVLEVADTHTRTQRNPDKPNMTNGPNKPPCDIRIGESGRATPSAMPSNIRMESSAHKETSIAQGVRKVAKDQRVTPHAMTTLPPK